MHQNICDIYPGYQLALVHSHQGLEPNQKKNPLQAHWWGTRGQSSRDVDLTGHPLRSIAIVHMRWHDIIPWCDLTQHCRKS